MNIGSKSLANTITISGAEAFGAFFYGKRKMSAGKMLEKGDKYGRHTNHVSGYSCWAIIYTRPCKER